MELLVTDTRGVASIIRNNQSSVEEAGFSSPFTVDNRNSTVYYVESGKAFGIPLRNPYKTWVSELPYNSKFLQNRTSCILQCFE